MLARLILLLYQKTFGLLVGGMMYTIAEVLAVQAHCKIPVQMRLYEIGDAPKMIK